jgi:hypothetical protein
VDTRRAAWGWRSDRAALKFKGKYMRRLSPHGRAWFFLGNLVALAIGCAIGVVAAPVHAQSLGPPWDYPPILSATPQMVLPADPIGRRIIFVNPSATASIAFCPSQIARNGVAFACAVNGAGSITLLPLASFLLDGGTPQGPPLAMGAAWFGVSTAASVPATVLEFE